MRMIRILTTLHCLTAQQQQQDSNKIISLKSKTNYSSLSFHIQWMLYLNLSVYQFVNDVNFTLDIIIKYISIFPQQLISSSMEHRNLAIRQKTPTNKHPTPTDYSSILVYRLRAENMMLKEKIRQLERDHSCSPIHTPIKQRKTFRNRDDIQQRFDSKLKSIKDRSLSATKSSHASQKHTHSQNYPCNRNSVASSKGTVRDAYQNDAAVYKTHNTTRKMIHHQPQPSFSSTSSDCLYKGIYLNDSIAIESNFSTSPRVLAKCHSNKTSTENSAQKRKKARIRGITGSFGCNKQSIVQVHGDQSNQSSAVSWIQKENQDYQLRVSPQKLNTPHNASFKKGKLHNDVYLQEGPKLDQSKSSRIKTVRN